MEVVGGHCPHCGAALDLSLAAREVRCSYCGKVSVVRPREAPRPVPHVPPPQPRPAPPPPPAPRSAAPALLALVLVVGASMAAFFVMRKASTTRGPTTTPAPKSASPVVAPPVATPPKVERGVRASFARTRRPFVVDLDGDRVSDLVLRNGDELFAYAGASGKRLWSAPAPSKGWPNFSFVREGRVLHVNEVGLTAFDGKTGKKLFGVALPDRPELPCAAPPGAARLLLAEDDVASVDLATGAITAEKRGAPCVELTSDDPRGSVRRKMFPVSFLPAELGALACGGVKVSGTYEYVRADPCLPALGMRDDDLGELSLRAAVPVAGGGHALFGTKKRGKRAAMVGLARARKLVWSAVASPIDPASLPEEGPERSAIDGAHVAIAYTTAAGANLAVLELETGRRVADVPLGGKALFVVGLGGRFGAVLEERIVTVDAAGKVKTLVE